MHRIKAAVKRAPPSAAMMLDTIRGPNQRVLRGTAITVKDLSQTTQSFDAYLLMPGTSGQGRHDQ